MFCNKLAFYECRKVTKHDFRKKSFGPKMGHLGPKRDQNEVLGHFHVQNALIFADFASAGQCAE